MAVLTRDQKEAIGLLQIGTFLEYFDLMLYVHMAVLLNDLFFPKTDLHMAALLGAFAFCSTYLLRPFGALIFGYIGDHVGRKATVIITTMMMSISCVVMASLPTYEQIGISAAYMVTICRMVQGLSSMGEVIGAEVYVSEITRPPVGYAAVSFISVSCAAGAMVAVGIAALTTSYGFNWRTAFWVGACIAVVGSVARTRLRETPEFVDMKRKIKNLVEEQKLRNPEQLEKQSATVIRRLQVKTPISTLINCFFINCGWPLSFYLIYIYFNPILKQAYGYSAEQIIFHNFVLTVVQVLTFIMWSIMTRYVYPLKILKVKGVISLVLMVALPIFLLVNTSATQIFFLQTLMLIFALHNFPGQYIFLKQLPIYRRFTAGGGYLCFRTGSNLCYFLVWNCLFDRMDGLLGVIIYYTSLLCKFFMGCTSF